ncbi:sulfotransferase family protein [Nitrosococcus wardiae]|uniref:sulfotransferase family protein n=1 Tax=Nitrosococcus wardiae TaxID=1814290 RepID=UPI0019814F57|nr:sulfotransferase [Nitrosococcus wardiae]
MLDLISAKAFRRETTDGFWIKVEKTLCHHGDQVRRGLRGLWWDRDRAVANRPLFVVGCSRAGTTLVYRTFSEAAELGSLKRETHDFWNSLHPIENRGWKTHALNRNDAQPGEREAVSRYFYIYTGQRRFIDKNNQNGLSIPYLHALFPDAHFVYVKRNPGDNIHSLIEGWTMPERFGTWSGDLPARLAIEGGRYTRWCFFLAEGWSAYCDASIEEVCAFQYRIMNQAILKAREEINPAQWTEIAYEDVLANPVQAFQSAFASAGLSFNRHLEQHCRTILSHPYNAFSEIKKDKWKSSENARRIERVLPRVAGVAKQMGYCG